ncbi:MAG TPA: carboxypeptidase-like regulatory domain-containing protein [Planctomycetota bacterium]
MQKQTVVVLLGALFLLCAGGLFVQQTLVDGESPVGKWTEEDEIEVPGAPEAEGAPLPEVNDLDRTAADPEGTGGGGEQRVAVLLRGRVIDKFQQPVAEARVWLDFGRGGQRGGPQNRQRRVPEPVMTDREGRFAFQGQTFRNLQVSLQVLHRTHALGQFDKDIEDVSGEVDLGDLVLLQGGELRGRVTDLDGNGIAAAELQLNPENGNGLRFMRERERLLAGASTDANGFFRCVNVPSGNWSASATAKRHTEGRSATFAVEEEQLVDIDDIRLGPGYEITGYVKSALGQPIAKATVVMQGENRNRNVPGGRGNLGEGGGGRGGRGGGPGGGAAFGQHRTTTDEQGRFFLEHLPGVSMRLETSAEGYLDNTLTGIDTTSSPPVLVTMQDGLRITGTVRDGDSPVTMFAVRALRVRGLPQPGRNSALDDVQVQMRDGNPDDAPRARPRAQFGDLREGSAREARVTEGRRGGRGNGPADGPGPPGGGPGGGWRDLGKPERHAGGIFVATGLQEGIYEVHVQSPDHTRYRSAEVELRVGAPPPDLSIALDAGVSVAGIVRSEGGAPVAGARVELRTASADEGAQRRQGSGNNGANGAERAVREVRQAVAAMWLAQEATTGADGTFVIKHAQRGNYRLHAEARGFSGAQSEPFELLADRSGFELKLGALGSIAGQVRGLGDGEFSEARVAAVPMGNPQGGVFAGLFRGRGGNPFNGVRCGADGRYRIEGLVPGTYAVRAWIGSPQDIMRELAPQFLDGSMAADVTVRAAEVATLDVTVIRPQVGTVTGNVMHNGTPAAGFQVELTRLDESGSPPGGNGGRGPGGGGRGGMGGMFGGLGRSLQTAVAQSGNFSFANVPAGSYRLRVQSARRGGMLHEETVQVTTNATSQYNVVLQTANLEGSITRDDGGNVAELNGRVSLLPGLTALPENLNTWQRENTTFDARLQNGTFKFNALKPGGYLLVLNVRGRERTATQIVVGSTDQKVVVPAGKATPVTPGQNGGGQNRATNGPPR